MKRRLMVVVVAGAVVGSAGACRAPAGVPDRELGLRKTPLADDQAPPVVVFKGDSPGNNQRLLRSYEGAPPVIPHNLDGMAPITREENFCVACHASGSTDPADPPQVPRSHLVDWRTAPGVVRESVAGARWNCTACHVVQSDSAALVPNTFGSDGPAKSSAPARKDR